MLFSPGLEDFVKDAAEGKPRSGFRLVPKFPSDLKIL